MQDTDKKLIEACLTKYRSNPLAFVEDMYPWGEGILRDQSGPRQWQADTLELIAKHIETNKTIDPKIFQYAVASGRGTGKSCLFAWITHWFISCVPGATVVVTANSEPQLTGVTFPEILKWFNLGVNRHLFDNNKMALFPTREYKRYLQALAVPHDYHYVQGRLWTEENPDAFAGIHNPLGLLLLMDEASGIPASIHNIAKGFFTEASIHRYWLMFSNPRRVNNPFHRAFRNKQWITRNLDARTVEGTDKAIYEAIIEEHGEDSYEAKVEVYGEFPEQGYNQLFSRTLVEEAMQRPTWNDPTAPLIMAIDVARFGDDTSVFAFRKGMDAKSITPMPFKGYDTMALANAAAHVITQYNPTACFVDGAGVGGGVVDRLRQLGYPVVDVNVGVKADNTARFVNKRAEIYYKLKEWMRQGAIAEAYAEELLQIEYLYRDTSQQMQLESKKDAKARGIKSPDYADALALTFSQPVAGRVPGWDEPATRVASDNYDIYGGINP